MCVFRELQRAIGRYRGYGGLRGATEGYRELEEAPGGYREKYSKDTKQDGNATLHLQHMQHILFIPND